MPSSRSPAQQAASRTNGARSHRPTTETGKARSARNGTKHGLHGGSFTLLPGEDYEEFAALHAAVISDWGPRDAYECRWVMELVTSMWRQDRLRVLELATLTAAAAESPPSDAMVMKLTTFARYGARIDKDISRAPGGGVGAPVPGSVRGLIRSPRQAAHRAQYQRAWRGFPG